MITKKTNLKSLIHFLILIVFLTIARNATASTPIINAGLPTGVLAANTSQITISVQTDVDSTCKYAYNATTSYDDANYSYLFTTTGGTTHSKDLNYPQYATNGQIYNFYVLCSDAVGNISPTPYVINFSVDSASEPVLSNGSPSGVLPFGTTETVMQLSSQEFVTCRSSSTPGTPFDSMEYFFQDSGTHHSVPILEITPGITYTYYVRCQYPIGNPNTTDFPISFSVSDTAADLTPPASPSGMTVI